MYAFKELYVLDFSRINYYSEIHQIIKDELDFPDCHGRNWDAFWDSVTDMAGEPLHIEIRGMERLQSRFPEGAKTLLDLLKRLKHVYNDKYARLTEIKIILGGAEHEIT